MCYILIEKRGDCIKKLINWKLLSDNVEVVYKENEECEFDNNILTYYEEDNTVNIINIVEKSYKRENKEFTFNVDFKNRCFNYTLKPENLSIENAKIDASFEYINKNIVLKYNLGDENKELIIKFI